MCKYVGVIALCLVACATAPKTAAERRDLVASAQTTLQTMVTKDPELRSLLDRAYAYAVFPNVGKGGVIAGAAYGRGVLFEQGRQTGYVELNQGSLGAQLGAQTFAELVIFQTREAVDRVRANSFTLGADVGAVVLTAGAAASAVFRNGVTVLVQPKGGAMIGISVSGQTINFTSG